MTNTDKWFPCPICLRPLDVRTSKTKKPYVICSACGVQMFVRERAGIQAFAVLVEQARKDNVFSRVGEMERRYRPQCPECGESFWITPDRVVTNRLTGHVTGYRCHHADCHAIVPPDTQMDSASEAQKTERRRPASQGKPGK